MPKLIFEDTEKNLQMVIRYQEAFGVIWDISERLRAYDKHETEKTRDEIIDELNEIISENNILNLYE
jgi:hypothetical protein